MENPTGPGAQPQQVPVFPLPFPPTDAPGHPHVMALAETIIMLSQTLFNGNPAAIITALSCANHVYLEEAKKNEMPEEVIEQFEVMGLKLGKQMLEMMEKQKREQETGIVTPDSRLVGPDGRPLIVASASADETASSRLSEDDDTDEEVAEEPETETEAKSSIILGPRD